MLRYSFVLCKNTLAVATIASSVIVFTQAEASCAGDDTPRVWPLIPKSRGAMTPEHCIAELKKLQKAKKPQESLNLLNICLRDRPDVVALYYYRALAYMQLKNYEKALIDCSRQIKLEPSLVKPYEMRAQCYLALKDRKHALRDFRSIVAIEPYNKCAHEQLALIYRQEGDTANWKRELDLAKQCTGKRPLANPLVSPEVLTRHDHPVSAYLQNAGEHLAHKKPALALDEIKKALASSDRDFAVEHLDRGEAYDLQAQAFQQMEVHDKAIDALNKVLKYQPNNNRAYYLLAQSYFAMGKYQECLVNCDKASRGDKLLSNTVADLKAKAAARLKH